MEFIVLMVVAAIFYWVSSAGRAQPGLGNQPAARSTRNARDSFAVPKGCEITPAPFVSGIGYHKEDALSFSAASGQSCGSRAHERTIQMPSS